MQYRAWGRLLSICLLSLGACDTAEDGEDGGVDAAGAIDSAVDGGFVERDAGYDASPSDAGSDAPARGPLVLAIRPSAIPTGVQASVSLEGLGFSPTASVSLTSSGGEIALEDVVVSDSQSLDVTVPSSVPAGTYEVTVVNGDGQRSPAFAALVVSSAPPPQILEMNPARVVALTGETREGNLLRGTFAGIDPAASFALLPEGGPAVPLTPIAIPSPCSPCDIELDSFGTAPAGLYVLEVTNPDGQRATFSPITLMLSTPNGLPGSYESERVELRMARQRFAAVGLSIEGTEYLVAAGGTNAATVMDSVEVLALDERGHIISSALTRRLTQPRAGLALFTTEATDGSTYVYAFGGSSDPSGSPGLATGERARVIDARSAPQAVTLAPSTGTLAPGRWSYRVAAVDPVDGEGWASAVRSIALSSAGGVEIQWTAVPGASSYVIYRSDAPNVGAGHEHLVATVAATMYLDNGAAPIERVFPGTVTAVAAATGGTLAPGSYRYSVTATTIHGETAASAETIVDVPAGGNASVDLSWPAYPSDAWGDDALAYNVYRSDANAPPSSAVLVAEGLVGAQLVDDGYSSVLARVLPDPVATTETIASGVLAGGLWSYRVAAITDRGESLPSASVSVTVAAPANAVRLDWAPVDGAIGYRIYRSDVPDGATLHRIDEVQSSQYVDVGVEAGTEVVADGRQRPPVGRLVVVREGSLGRWQALASSASLATPRYGLVATVRTITLGAAQTPVVFAIGGRDDATDLPTIERAAIASDGSLSAWTASGTLDVGRSFAAAAWADASTVPNFAGTASAYLNVVGGRSGNTVLMSVETGTETDGVLGTLTIRDGQRAIVGHGVLLSEGVLRVVGGTSGLTNPPRPTVDINPIELDTGSILGGSSAPERLYVGRAFFASLPAAGRFYVLGGCVESSCALGGGRATESIESIPF